MKPKNNEYPFAKYILRNKETGKVVPVIGHCPKCDLNIINPTTGECSSCGFLLKALTDKEFKQWRNSKV